MLVSELQVLFVVLVEVRVSLFYLIPTLILQSKKIVYVKPLRLMESSIQFETIQATFSMLNSTEHEVSTAHKNKK